MEINNTNAGASTYAMKKALEMPNLLLSLVQQTVNSGKQSLRTDSPMAIQTLDRPTLSDKGKIIDLVA